ncbi:MAG: DUF1328 domain-containing protein [Aequorivita sp.]|nr:DUF1328 domain-containing protein [Aequorivita sp.]
MLHWKAIYIILAIVFGVVGFIGIGDGGLEPAKYIAGIFLLLLLVIWFFDFRNRKRGGYY